MYVMNVQEIKKKLLDMKKIHNQQQHIEYVIFAIKNPVPRSKLETK